MNFYSKSQAYFQKKFKTLKLAKRLEELSVRDGLNDFAIDFISSMNMMFISSVNQEGYPTVSYKGGEKGFILIKNRNEFCFPNYDGNGMFLTLGNILETKKVGILVISFEKPFRIRVEGTASISRSENDLSKFPGAIAVIEVNITRVWENCPRYIHRVDSMSISKSIPTSNNSNINAEWKRISLLQDVLPAEVVRKNLKMGTIDAEEWKKRVHNGDPSAE